MSEIFDNYKGLYELRKMPFSDLDKFAQEIRNFLINKISKTGGHLASNRSEEHTSELQSQ